MRIWHLKSNLDDFDWMQPISDLDMEKLFFDCTPRIKGWVPVPVKTMEYGEFSDAPHLNPSAPVFSEKAVDLLKDLIGESVEFLPLRSRKGEFYAVNVLKVLDCVDYERSKFKQFPQSDRIMWFTKYTFREDCLQGADVFKLVDEPEREPFVSDAFRDRVLKSDLTGFVFELVWDSSAK